MKRSPLALALAAALGTGAALSATPVLAQQGASMVAMPIRTGSNSIGWAFGVRLAVHDRQSFELSWNRVSGAATYRLAVGGRTVQDNGGLPRYVAGVDLSGGFDHTLTALDRSGKALATQRFRVQPASATQLVSAAGVSRSTLYAKVKGGELSRTSEGTIDAAELLRVFGELTESGRGEAVDVCAAAVPGGVAGDAAAVAAHVAWLRGLVDDQRAALERKDRELGEAATRLHEATERAERREATWLKQLDAMTTKLLPAPTQPDAPEPSRGIFRRLFG